MLMYVESGIRLCSSSTGITLVYYMGVVPPYIFNIPL